MIVVLNRQFETSGESDYYYIKKIKFQTSRHVWKNDRVVVVT